MARRVRLVKNSNDRSRKLVADSAERSRQQSGLDFLQRQRPHNLWLVSPGRGNDRPDSGKTQGKIIPREIISYDRRGSLVISLFAALWPVRYAFRSPATERKNLVSRFHEPLSTDARSHELLITTSFSDMISGILIDNVIRVTWPFRCLCRVYTRDLSF